MTPPGGLLIYGTGNVGCRVARLADERGWRVAGAVNRDGPKVGQDLGILAGLADPLGVTILPPDRLAEAASDADIAVVGIGDRLSGNFDHYKTLMEAGLNIICAGCEASDPWVVPGGLADELDSLAKARGVTLTGTGFQDPYRISLVRVLAGPCGTLRSISHESRVDVSVHGAEASRLCGVGLTPAEFAEKFVSETRVISFYRLFIEQAARAVGLSPMRVTETVEPTLSNVPLPCPALGSTIAPGSPTGSRATTWIETAEGVRVSAVNELRLFSEGETEILSWEIDGEPPARAELTGLDSSIGTAAAIVARIPDVLAAPPGIVTIDKLPPLTRIPA